MADAGRPQLPLELLSVIVDKAGPTGFRSQFSLVSKAWNAASRNTRTVELRARGIESARHSITNILRCFPRLQRLRLLCDGSDPESMDALAVWGTDFAGHPTLMEIHSETSAVVPGALRCPNLRSLKLREDYAMPVPHLLSLPDNILMAIAESVPTLKEIDFDCPLALAVGGSFYSDDDEDDDEIAKIFRRPNTKTNLKKLTLRSLHTLAATDVLSGFIGKALLPSLYSLTLESTDAGAALTTDQFILMTDSCPNLQSLALRSFSLNVAGLMEWTELLPRDRLRTLVLDDCTVPIGSRLRFGRNVGGCLVSILAAALPSLEHLSLLNCTFRGVLQIASAASCCVTLAEGERDSLAPLRRLELAGLGTLLENLDFLKAFPNVRALAVDGASIEILKMLLVPAGGSKIALADLDVRLAGGRPGSAIRRGPSFPVEVEDGYQRNADHGLHRLSIASLPTLDHAIKLVRSLKSITHLQLEDIGASQLTHLQFTEMLTMAAGHSAVLFPSLKCLTVHLVGSRSAIVARLALARLLSGARDVRHLSVRLTGTREEEQRIAGPAEEALDALVIDRLMEDCPNLRALRLEGLSFEYDALARMCASNSNEHDWSESHPLQLRGNGLPYLDDAFHTLLERFLRAYKQLQVVHVCIERLPRTLEGAKAGGGIWARIARAVEAQGGLGADDGPFGTKRAISEEAALSPSSLSSSTSPSSVQLLCRRYAACLRSAAWWVARLSVEGDGAAAGAHPL